jgi:GT2 family glycosyltransferase
MIELSFIIVTYNTKELTQKAIESIRRLYGKIPRYEIILVDNGSTDGSREYFENQKYKNFVYLYNHRNAGFGKANNLAFRKSRGRYIYLLNNDAQLETQGVDGIVKSLFENNPDAGIIATKVVYPDGNAQPNVQSFSGILTVILRLIRAGAFVRRHKNLLALCVRVWPFNRLFRSYLGNFTEREQSYIEWASGCSLIFRRALYESLDGFDERFFLYSEDEDICLRAARLGAKILYTPEILVTHHEGMSGTKNDLNEFIIRTRMASELYFFRKNHPSKYPFVLCGYFVVSVLGYVFSKRMRIIFSALSKNG